MSDLIYLDYNATTPVADEVLAAMQPWMQQVFWNAASAHRGGRVAAAAVERARQQFAEAVCASPREIVFTSGATEANNLAVKGVAAARAQGRNRVIIGATEHKAVLEAADSLRRFGIAVSVLPVDANGLPRPDVLAEQLDDDVALVSVMLVNNETGVVSPIAELAGLAHSVGALFHTDATQALGRIPVDLARLSVDLASFSGHKVYGPKGIGALFVSRHARLEPLVHGGGHERGLRSGTLNVPGIVGFGLAAERGAATVADESQRQAALVQRFLSQLRALVPDVEVIGADVQRVTNTVMVRIPGAEAEAVMANAPDVAVSAGSACTAFVPTASHVLLALGMPEEHALECIRVSVGRPTTEHDVVRAAIQLGAAAGRVRSLTDPAVAPLAKGSDHDAA